MDGSDVRSFPFGSRPIFREEAVSFRECIHMYRCFSIFQEYNLENDNIMVHCKIAFKIEDFQKTKLC